MNKELARDFAGLMESYLDIPAFMAEAIETRLLFNEFEEVIKFVVKRRKEIENERIKG